MVAHNPLHRSRRAALPHRAPALGDDVEASPWIGMADTRGRQPAVDVSIHPLPREAVFLTAAPERAAPQSSDLTTEGDESPAVQRHAVVAHVPGHDRAQIRAL